PLPSARATTPDALREATWAPEIPTHTESRDTPAMLSAARTASRTACPAASTSTTIPRCTPRDALTPTPMMPTAPSAVSSPMQAHTLVVPTSRPPTNRRLATARSLPPGPLPSGIPQPARDSLQCVFGLFGSHHRRPGQADVDKAVAGLVQKFHGDSQLAFQFRAVADQHPYPVLCLQPHA